MAEYKRKLCIFALLRVFCLISELSQSTPEGITAGPIDDDFFEWKALITGYFLNCIFVYHLLLHRPPNTPFAGGIFPAKLTIPDVNSRFIFAIQKYSPISGLSAIAAAPRVHMQFISSECLHRRPHLHQHPSRCWRRPAGIREARGAMVSGAIDRENSRFCRQHASWSVASAHMLLHIQSVAAILQSQTTKVPQT